MTLVHSGDHAGHRFIEIDALRRELAGLPLTDVSVRRGLGGVLVRFHAQRSQGT
jgi:hypothetical protein